jgi:hypothetical protein
LYLNEVEDAFRKRSNSEFFGLDLGFDLGKVGSGALTRMESQKYLKKFQEI